MPPSRGLRSPVLASLACIVGCSSSSGGSPASPADGGGADGPTTTPDAGAPDGGATLDGAVTGNGLAWISGTRLRAVLQSAESASLFTGWHDTQLGVECQFYLASDGKTRCLPSSDVISSEYDDKNCTNPVGVVPKTSEPAKYLPPPYAPFVCGAGTEFHAVGAAYAPAALYYFDGTACVADTVIPGDDYVHFGAAIPASTFVAATAVADPRGARLSATQFVGEDGSRQDTTMLDAARGGAPCEVLDNRDGDYRCTPNQLAYIEYFFSDALCAVPVAYHPEYAEQVCAQKPTAVLDSTGAVQDREFYEIGAKDTAVVYEGQGTSSCQPYTRPANSGGAYYAIGARIPLTSFASLTTKNEGSGRIQLTVARTESSALAREIGFFDSSKNTACQGILAADGTTRCLPASVISTNVFADSACSQALLTIVAGQAPPVAGEFVEAQTGIGDRLAVSVLADKIAMPASVWQWGKTCEVAGIQTADYYATTPVPPTDFVPVTTATE